MNVAIPWIFTPINNPTAQSAQPSPVQTQAKARISDSLASLTFAARAAWSKSYV